jgi:GMP synthase (glutamine-hydrolysing)
MGREWGYTLRAVTSTDGLTADYYPFEHGFLAAVSIVSEAPIV